MKFEMYLEDNVVLNGSRTVETFDYLLRSTILDGNTRLYDHFAMHYHEITVEYVFTTLA